MQRLCALIFASLLGLVLAGCSFTPQGAEVIQQARPGGQVAFDVVDLNDNALHAVLAHQQPSFQKRFKEYRPPAELKVAIGDIVSVVIWESSSNGLYGESLTELSFDAGAAAQAATTPSPNLPGVPTLPPGVTAPPNLLAQLYGGAPANGGSATNGAGVAGQVAAALGGLAGAGNSAQLEQLLDAATQSGRPGTRIPDQQVGSDGAITIPYAGRIKVVGLTPEQIQKAIEARLADKALDPQALVVVDASAENSVSVAGDVAEAKRVPLAVGGDRLLQVIAAAGGPKTSVPDTVVELSRGGVTASVPLATLVADPAQNIFAEPGDVLTLVQRPKTYSVFGATGQNTTINFASDRLSLSEALAKASGLLDDRADPRSVFLFRYEPTEVVQALGQPIATNAHDGLSPMVYRLDLSKGRSYLLARQFPMHDKDVLFVADAPSRRVYQFFQALSLVTGPVISAVAACQTAQC